VLTIYGYDRERLECHERYCHYRYPEKLLHEVAMENSVMYIDILGLVIILVFLRVVAFFCLRWRIKSER
jgi:ATP-binding cassette subfamily G (WHITE) protein 1